MGKFAMMRETTISSFVVLSLYLLTRYPSVPGGDAGELLSEACNLGVPHPPGYPLFTLLSSMFIRMGSLLNNFQNIFSRVTPVSEYFTPARSVNTMCNIFGAGTSLFLGETVSLYIEHRVKHETKIEEGKSIFSSYSAIVGAISGSLFALSPLTWEYSIGTEVFALNNFLLAILLYLTLNMSIQGKEVGNKMCFIERGIHPTRSCSLGAILCGLSLANQHTSVLFIYPLIVYVLLVLFLMPSNTEISISRILGWYFFLFVVGLLPYFYLYLSSLQPKEGSWGDSTSLLGFLTHVLRSEYGTLSLGISGAWKETEGSFARWIAYFCNCSEQFSYLGLACFVAGSSRIINSTHKYAHFSPKASMICNPSQKKSSISESIALDLSIGNLFLFLFIFYLYVWNGILSNLPLDNPMPYEVHSRFWMQPNLLFCFFIGVGYDLILTTLFTNRLKQKICLGRICLLVVISILTFRFHTSDQIGDISSRHGRWIVHDYAKAVLNSIPEQSLLLSYSDLNWNSIRYLKTCERKRADLTHLSIHLMPYPWFQRQIDYGLYPGVIFPSLLPNVSTDLLSKGHAEHISRFLDANLKSGHFKGGIYIEIQAIPNNDIGVGGSYRGQFTLIPWGLVYRVIPFVTKPHSELFSTWHHFSIKSLTGVKKDMKNHIKANLKEGSWEFAAMTIVWDMQYQFGLHMLSLGIDSRRLMRKKHHLIINHLKYLEVANKVLWQVTLVIKSRKSFSHLKSDVIKNTALASMQYYQIAKLLPDLKRNFPELPNISKETNKSIASRAKIAVLDYLKTFNTTDKDFGVFENFYNQTLV